MKPILSLLLLLTLAVSSHAAGRPPNVAGDGIADDTAAIQAALDAQGKTGGAVSLPPGVYRIAGSLRVPTGVTLRGSWDAPHHAAWDKGTTLAVTGGRGHEDGPAAVELSESSSLQGVTMVWPEQKWDGITAYPWAIHGQGMHNDVENVTFVNAYQGIKIGVPWSELHLIRNVFGCVLRRGIFIDTTSDIGRIENVHFNEHYWARSHYPRHHDRQRCAGHGLHRGQSGGVRLRAHRLGVRPEHLRLRRAGRLPVHPHAGGASATASSWASARTAATSAF